MIRSKDSKVIHEQGSPYMIRKDLSDTIEFNSEKKRRQNTALWDPISLRINIREGGSHSYSKSKRRKEILNKMDQMAP